MKLKELCAITDCELCIILGSIHYWVKKTKTIGIDKSSIPPQWFDYEIEDIKIDVDCWNVYYLEIFLKNS